MIFTIARVKVIAAFLGPAGMGVVSLYANFFELGATLFSAGYGGALNREIPRLSAIEQERVWQTAAWLTYVPVLVLSPLLIWAFYASTSTLRFSFVSSLIMAVILVCSAAWRLISGYMMGHQMSRQLFRALLLGSLLPLVGAGVLVSLGIREPLAYAATAPALVLIGALGSGVRKLLTPQLLGRLPTRSEAVGMVAIAVPIMLTMILIPGTWFYIRLIVESRLGQRALGYLQPSFQITVLIFGLFTTFSGMTVLRWDQSLESPYSRRELLLLAVACGIPIVGSAATLLVRPLFHILIVALFSKAFAPSSGAVPWFIVGETLRMGGFLLDQTCVSKGYTLRILWPRVLAIIVVVLLIQSGYDRSIIQIGEVYLVAQLAAFAVSLLQWLSVQNLPPRVLRRFSADVIEAVAS